VTRIDTLEDFRAARSALEPVYITSRTHGKILVPCVNTWLVRVELVVANAYNPNSVPPDRLQLLLQSILDNGFCFPVVAIWDDESEKFVIIDGFHRSLVVGTDWLDCDYIPVVLLAHDMSKRLAATWQFNKARGVHQVDLDADLIRRLVEQGLTDEQIGERLGVDLDTVYRYKQVTGVAALFQGATWSTAWEMREDNDAG
jgi:ParB-like chromosome segregation protein Spo0J